MRGSSLLRSPLALGVSAGIATVMAQTFDPAPGESNIHWEPWQVGTNKSTNATYSNPVMTSNVGDPWMTRYSLDGEDWYLFTYSTNDNITIKRSRYLTDNWDKAEERCIFKPDPESGEPWSTSLWAPEIHNISDTWYVIFSATHDADNPKPLEDAPCKYNCPAINHRMFVLESSSNDPWTADYSKKPIMLNTYDQFAIDGTYFQHPPTGGLYHIYSCWEDRHSAWPANLCITQFSSPSEISTPTPHHRRMISIPSEPWERVPYGSPSDRLATNEGPTQLTNPKTGQIFLLYSAARVNTPFYCLGLLELTGNDPMEYSSWKKDTSGCVFYQNTLEGVYGTGHASFTTSPDGEESYIVYHAQTIADPFSDLYRTVRIQKFEWDEQTGRPVFPLAGNGPFVVPSGQMDLTTN